MIFTIPRQFGDANWIGSIRLASLFVCKKGLEALTAWDPLYAVHIFYVPKWPFPCNQYFTGLPCALPKYKHIFYQSYQKKPSHPLHAFILGRIRARVKGNRNWKCRNRHTTQKRCKFGRNPLFLAWKSRKEGGCVDCLCSFFEIFDRMSYIFSRFYAIMRR